MVVTSQEIKELVGSALASLTEGLEGTNCMIAGLVDFEIAVIKVGDMKGGFKLILADASGKYSEKSISKIKFSVLSKDLKNMICFLRNF